MFKQMLLCTALIGSAFVGSIGASASEYGTPDEARAMLARAVVEVKADKPGAIAKFNHNDRQFRDRDLFVFCFNGQDGKFTAHEAMVTRDVRTFRDKTGKAFGEEMYRNPKEGQIVEVAFMSPVPGSTGLVAKRSYVTRIGDQVCGVSAYDLNGTGKPTQ
jgi:hypothetical protein